MPNVDDVEALDAAWSRGPLAVVLPSRGSPHVEWANQAAASVPDSAGERFALLTSGSTGRPKLVVGSRRRSEALTEELHRRQLLDDVEQTILTLPVTYSYALVNQWLWARHHGRRMVVTEGFADPATLLDALDSASDAMVCLVGSQVPLLARLAGDRSFPGVIRVNFAGGRFPQEHLDALTSRFPNALVFNNYGCAEALPRLTVRPAADAQDPAVIGSPIDGVELRSTDGALEFRSRFGAEGLVDDEGWREVDRDDWLPTGDLGSQRPDGRWVLAGRKGDVFKRHGEKVSTGDLLATTLGAWSGQALVAQEIDAHGETGAVIVLAPTPADAEVKAVLRAFRANHPRPHWPLRIESVERFEELATGKLDVQAWRDDPTKVVHWWQRL